MQRRVPAWPLERGACGEDRLCANPKQAVREPEGIVIVQAGSERSDHGHSQDQESKHHRGLTTALVGGDESRYGDVGAWGPQWCSRGTN